jgi:hypothetical protein
VPGKGIGDTVASLCNAFATIADRSRLYKDLASGPFFGFNARARRCRKG